MMPYDVHLAPHPDSGRYWYMPSARVVVLLGADAVVVCCVYGCVVGSTRGGSGGWVLRGILYDPVPIVAGLCYCAEYVVFATPLAHPISLIYAQ